MTDSPEKPDHGENPTDEDIDVEGPNESAPGHEPDPDEDDES
ncbi:MAG: hypothetical protein QOJ07_3678 [Thermoleophilaceae bacterium]|jgi:hypothetical protein|nr:hypothetical protein [Thermoleophilaceae bacterium]